MKKTIEKNELINVHCPKNVCIEDFLSRAYMWHKAKNIERPVQIELTT